MVNKSKKIEVSEIIKPNIINGFDLSLTCLKGTSIDEEVLLSLSLFRRLEKSLLTFKNKFN